MKDPDLDVDELLVRTEAAKLTDKEIRAALAAPAARSATADQAPNRPAGAPAVVVPLTTIPSWPVATWAMTDSTLAGPADLRSRIMRFKSAAVIAPLDFGAGAFAAADAGDYTVTVTNMSRQTRNPVVYLEHPLVGTPKWFAEKDACERVPALR